MASITIALTGQFVEATLMVSLLTDTGFHPDPIEQSMQVTALGGESGYQITVPEEEAALAFATLESEGFEKCLSR
jgi:hypothetical protein